MIAPTTFASGVKRCENWEISFDLYLDNQPEEWTSIFQVTATGAGDMNNQLGSRLPGLFTRKHPMSSAILRLWFYTHLGNDRNHFFIFNVNKFTWYNIKISEFDGLYSVSIDNQVVYSKLNYSPREWESVDFQMARPTGHNYEPTTGRYRNFEFDLCARPGGNLLSFKRLIRNPLLKK